MLKCVVFAVTSYFYEFLLERRSLLEEKLYSEKMDLVIFEKSAQAAGDNTEIEQKNYAKKDLLLVTDDEEALKEFREAGFYVIALQHDKNREIGFSGVPYIVEDVEQLAPKSYEEAYRRLAGLPWDILETERLKLRESTVKDVDDFYRIYEDASVTAYMEDLFSDPEEEKAYMKAYIEQVYGFYGFGLWTVLQKETGRIIGRAGLSIREGYELPELGFVIGVPYQKKGYALEACRAIMDYAKEELNIEKIQALVQAENEASLKLLCRLGFLYEKRVTEGGQEYCLMIKQLI